MCADLRKYAQLQPFTLAGSGAVIGATSIIMSAPFNSIDGVPLAMSDFGTKGYMTLEPGSLDKEEQISFTGIVQNANGTATLTGVKNVLFLYPYTETSGLVKSHGGGVTVVVSNTSAFYDSFANKNDTETITQEWTFPSTEADRPKLNADTDALALEDLIDFGQLSRTAMAGTVNASEVVNGVVQLATNAEMGTATSVGTTGARLVPPNSQLVQASSGAADANKIPTLGGAGALAHGFIDSTGTWSTVQSFTANTAQITTDPDSANDAVRFSFLTTAVAAAFKTGTSGEALAIGDAIYLKASDGKLYKTDADGDESTFSFAGINQTTAVGADVTINFVTAGGIATGLAGLVAGTFYYLSGTAGALATTPGARYAKVGQAMSTTTLRVIEPKFVAKGSTTITATGNTVITTGFYPAYVEVRAQIIDSLVCSSVGDDSNTCVIVNANADAVSTASSGDVFAWYLYDAGIKNDGTVSAKSATGFTLNCNNHVLDASVRWAAYSE